MTGIVEIRADDLDVLLQYLRGERPDEALLSEAEFRLSEALLGSRRDS